LPDVGLVEIQDIEDTYWTGADVELAEDGYLSKEVYLTGPKGQRRVLRLLPDPDLFDIKVRQHYACSLSEWLDAVKSELDELLVELAVLAEQEKNPLSPLGGYGRTAEIVAHALETFDFDPPEPYASVYIPMHPKDLPATCCHRLDKSSPSMKDRAREIVKVLGRGALRVQFMTPDGPTLAENLAHLAESLATRKYTE